jgi:putative ATP-dependent endonuclease of the OLD family
MPQDSDPKYRKALQELENLQLPALRRVASRIQDSLRSFVPRVTGVDVKLQEENRFLYGRRGLDVLIDDGTVTSLSAKGDGVQSLVAIGLLRGQSPTGKDLVLALEEPESHLHPGAIHQLREVIYALGSEHQVVLTTHCPLFVDRTNLKANIVVSENKAAPARTIDEIRSLLGVRVSDNLAHAACVLVVEGASDARALAALLGAHSKTLKNAIGNALAIDHTSGSGNLGYKLSELKNAMCIAHCYFDNDKAANDAIAKATSIRLIAPADVQQVICKGMTESEFEDMIVPEVYQESIEATYGIKLMCKEFRNSEKWSNRLRQVFLSQAKRWTSSVEASVKELVTNAVVQGPSNCLIEAKKSSFTALVGALERKVQKAG